MGTWLSKLLGNSGERAAARYLRRQGFRIVSRQYTNKVGEIDLIAQDQETIVFVEVKTRRSLAAGHPTDAVDQRKQAKLSKTALSYLKQNQLLNQSARFDVVSVIWPDGQRKPVIEHYRNAFPAVGKGQMF